MGPCLGRQGGTEGGLRADALLSVLRSDCLIERSVNDLAGGGGGAAMFRGDGASRSYTGQLVH